MGLSIVDADGMGRAFPELQMETFGVYGISACPMVVSNEWGDCAVIEASDNEMMEWLSRGVAIRMGGAAYIAEYAMTGTEVKRTSVPRTLSLAIEVGRVLREAKAAHHNPFEALLTFMPQTLYSFAKVIWSGKVSDMQRETKNGFSVGRAKIDGFGAYDGTMEIEIQNENLIARVKGVVKAIVPDLICIMDSETAQPITTEGLRYGQRVTVISVSVPEMMRTPEALDVFGPSCFGLSEPYTKIEELTA